MKRNILAENMRRFNTKNLNEKHDDYSGGGILQQPGNAPTSEWIEKLKNRHLTKGPHKYSQLIVETQADIADRLNYMSQHVDEIDSFLPEISKMIEELDTILNTIQRQFPIYYKELNYWTYNVVKGHENAKAQLKRVLSAPESPETKDNLRDAAKLYAIYSEEAVEARNTSTVIDALGRMLGISN